MYSIYILYTFSVLFCYVEASAKNDAGGLCTTQISILSSA